MKYFLLILSLWVLSSCSTTNQKTNTYDTWGSRNLQPIGMRPLPTQKEINESSLWNYSFPDFQYETRRHEYEQKHKKSR